VRISTHDCPRTRQATADCGRIPTHLVIPSRRSASISVATGSKCAQILRVVRAVSEDISLSK